MKTVLCLVLLGLIVNSAFAVTASTASATGASFNSTPVKVFDSANSTATVNDAMITASTIYNPLITFGPGTDNTTLNVWAVKYAPGTMMLTGVVRRTLNATQVVNAPTDATESSVSAADTAISVAPATALRQVPVVGAGPNMFAVLATVGTANTYTGSMDMLMLYSIVGASVSQTVTVATAVASTATNVYSFAPNALWYEDGYIYVIYESLTLTGTGGSAMASVSTASGMTVALNLQAYGASNGTKLYTTATTLVTGLTNAEAATPYYAATTMAMGAGNNNSMSSMVQVLYKDTVAKKVMYVGVTRSTGAVATAAVAVSAADVTQSTTAAGVGNMPGGFFGSNYTYGYAIANYSQPMGTSTTAVYGIMANVNGTTTAGGTVQLAIPTTANGYISLMGYRYGMGLAAIISTPTSTSGVNAYSWMTYFANGTVNATTATALGSIQGTVSQFVDPQGGLWLGYYTYDTSLTGANANTGALTGYIGRLVSQVNYYNATSTTKAANVLATFAAILTFVIASLFMF